MQVIPSFICRSCRIHLRRRIRVRARIPLWPTQRPFVTSVYRWRRLVPYLPVRGEPHKDLHAKILSLKQLLDADDITAAHNTFANIFLTDGGADTLLNDIWNERFLEPPTLQLLSRVTARHGKTPDAPSPLQLLDQLQNAGLLQIQHYLAVLIQLLRDQRPTEEILPLFEAAANLKIPDIGSNEPVRRRSESLTEDEELLNGFFAGSSVDYNVALYAIFLHLLDASVKSSTMDSLAAHLYTLRIPAERHLREFLTNSHIDTLLASRIIKLASQAKSTLLFSYPNILRKAVERYIRQPDFEGLQNFYQYARSIQPSPLSEKSYTIFVTAFFSFGRSQQSGVVGVWNDMIKSGLNPSVNAWSDLIAGHGRLSRNPGLSSAIPTVWKRMILSGVVPDAHCWTSRIHAELCTNQVEAGLKSLQLMQEAGVKPTIATINAAIDGLVRFDHLYEVNQVLALADKLNIRADLITYNSLLRGIVKRGSVTDVIQVLKNMQSQNINPDAITVTTIVDVLYSQRSPPSVGAVLRLLDFMESLGVEPNVQTYTTIINGVLRAGDSEAVDTIFRIMNDRGIAPNATTYTILIKAAFNRQDVPAVENYWSALISKRVRPDRVLWTETLWGFAHVGDVERMQYYHKKMKQDPLKVELSLTGVSIILRALARSRQFAVARALAAEAVSEDSFLSVPNKGAAERIFWEVVPSIGTIEWVESLKGMVQQGRSKKWEEEEDMMMGGMVRSDGPAEDMESLIGLGLSRASQLGHTSH